MKTTETKQKNKSFKFLIISLIIVLLFNGLVFLVLECLTLTPDEAIQTILTGNMIIILDDNEENNDFIIQLNNNPKLFWLKQDFFQIKTNFKFLFPFNKQIFIFSNKYTDYKEKQILIDEITNQTIQILNLNGKTDYEKVLLIYDWLIENIEYQELPNCEDQTIYGAFIEKKARCAGYSKAFVYLLNKVQINAFLISGNSTINDESIPHTWVVAYIDNQPYYFDLTWDDKNFAEHSYDWFGANYEEISKSHVSDYNIKSAIYNQYNYYVYNDMYLEEKSEEVLLNMIERQGLTVYIKCANNDILQFVTTSVESLYFRNKVAKRLNLDKIQGLNIHVTEDVYCVHIQFF